MEISPKFFTIMVNIIPVMIIAAPAEFNTTTASSSFTDYLPSITNLPYLLLPFMVIYVFMIFLMLANEFGQLPSCAFISTAITISFIIVAFVLLVIFIVMVILVYAVQYLTLIIKGTKLM